MNKLVSIILPVYNGEKTILETVESVLNQTYSNFELYIINDGSSDNTDIICKKITDNRVKYFCRKNNGVSKTRNFALELIKGDYVVFIDSDDLYEKDYLYELVNKMQEGYELVTCGYKNFEKSKKKFIPNKQNYNNKLEYISYLQSLFLFNQIWNKIYLTSVIKKNNLKFNEDLSIAEDWNFNVDYLNKVENISVVNKELYKYRISSNGLGFKYRNDSGEIKLKIIDKMFLLFDSSNTDSFIANSYLKQYFAYFSSIVDKRNDLSKKKKKEKIKSILESTDYNFRIKRATECLSKNKFLFMLLKSKKTFLIYRFAILANLYDRLNKKVKFGL